MTPVAPENMAWIKVILVAVNCVQLPIIGFMIGGSLVTLTFEIFGRLDRKPHFRRFAEQLLAVSAPPKGLAFLLALTLALTLFCVQAGYPPMPLPGALVGPLLLFLVIGLAALHLYRYLRPPRFKSPVGILFGLSGIGCLLGACFLLLCAAALLLRPDEWPHLGSQPWLLLSWNGVAKFLQFGLLSMALAGGGILIKGYALARDPKADPNYCRFVQRTGALLALISVLAWPATLLFELHTLPAFARTSSLYQLAGAALVIGLTVSVLLLTTLEDHALNLSRPVFIFCLAMFLVWILSDHLAREQALNQQTLVSSDLMQSAFFAKQPPPAHTPAQPTAQAEGKAIFARLCSACHRFDRRVVGPPLQEVLPGYQGNLESLKDFIRHPEKKNPDYPPMPNLGLDEKDIDSVARYLLETIENR